jgi:hypothetical protein
VRQLSQVMRTMTSVITRPMIGSASFAPTATTAALARTPRLTKPSTRACSSVGDQRGALKSATCPESDLGSYFIADEADDAGSRTQPKMREGSRVDESFDRLTERDERADHDRKDDCEPGEPFAASTAQEERKPKRDRGQGIAEVVD